MRFLIVGAGAVGAVLGLSLEHQKHEVQYLLRKGRKRDFRHLILVDATTGEARKRDNPQAAELGDTLPPFEWVLVCVRGDQLDEALAALSQHVRPDATVGVASAAVGDVERTRAAHPGGPVFGIMPTFSAWSDEDAAASGQATVWRWLKPPLLPTFVSGEGDAKADEAAREFAAMLLAAGVPARAVPTRKSGMALMSSLMPLLAGLEAAGWDADKLAGDNELRLLTARAIRESAALSRVDLPSLLAADSAMARLAALSGALLAYTPLVGYELIVRGLPRVLRGDMGAMWRVHGPKIAGQTREMMDDAIAQAGRRGVEAVYLRVLRDRLPALAPKPAPVATDKKVTLPVAQPKRAAAAADDAQEHDEE